MTIVVSASRSHLPPGTFATSAIVARTAWESKQHGRSIDRWSQSVKVSATPIGQTKALASALANQGGADSVAAKADASTRRENSSWILHRLTRK